VVNAKTYNLHTNLENLLFSADLPEILVIFFAQVKGSETIFSQVATVFYVRYSRFAHLENLSGYLFNPLVPGEQARQANSSR